MCYRPLYESLLQQAGGSWFDFEGLIRDMYVAVLKQGDWAIDVGAHNGDHTFQMAQAVAPGGRVIAIEAVPSLVRQLHVTAERFYPHLRNQISFHQVGVSNSEGSAVFYFAPAVAGLSGLRHRAVLGGQAVETFPVNLTTIDTLCAGVQGSIRFMKVDIEGGEYDAFRGAIRTIERHRPIVVFEHAPTAPAEFGYAMADMLSLWSGLEYRLYDFFGNSYDGEEGPWASTMVGDFLAVPSESSEAQRLFTVVHDTLSKAGIQYEIVATT